jgi:hypothetical protein
MTQAIGYMDFRMFNYDGERNGGRVRINVRLFAVERFTQMAARVMAVCLATIGISVGALAGSASQAHALTYGFEPWVICANNKQAAEVDTRNMPLEPANGATVQAGTAVTFSGESSYALTFDLASSSALLASPDVDSGTGSQSGSFFRFTSTNATVVPRTIYWTASFTFTPGECEGPSTFTTPVRTLIVAPNEAELAATKKQVEEAAAKKTLEEEAAAKKKEEEVAAAGSVVLDSHTVSVESSRDAQVKLTCSDVATCAGKLTLTTSVISGNGKATHAKVESIGTGSFSIMAGKGATVDLALNKAGRELLSAAHGHLSVSLTIVRISPLPSKAQTELVRLEQQKAKGRR